MKRKGLSKEELKRYYADWGNEDTRKEFLTHNIRLAHAAANKFSSTGIEHDDLFQAASVGLWKAVETFDPKKGFTFATYAMRVMDNEILMMLRLYKKAPMIDNKMIISTDTPIGYDKDGGIMTLEDILVASELEVDNTLMGRELAHIIRSVMDRYDPKHTYIIELYMKGRRHVVIAEKMGMSRSGVNKVILKFKKDLKDELKKHWDENIIIK